MGALPDFADPAQVILGADALVESLLSLVDGAAALELDFEPFANRLDAAVLLEPEAGSEVQAKLAALATADARSLLKLRSKHSSRSGCRARTTSARPPARPPVTIGSACSAHGSASAMGSNCEAC